MARVSAMSQDVVKKYRDSKKNKLQRTFVSGSNAAENKGIHFRKEKPQFSTITLFQQKESQILAHTQATHQTKNNGFKR